MPSPFPGMDPYLEMPHIFPNFHSRMITYLEDDVQTALPEPYFASSSERVWIEFSERYVEPDISVTRRRPRDEDADTDGGVAVLAPPRTKPILIAVPQNARRESFLEISTRLGDEERLVTVVEILSRTNKTVGGERRQLYVRKQQEILRSRVNLVEIDLLRSGEHSTAVPMSILLREAGEYDYHICVRRFFDDYQNFWVYPILLQEPLPRIDVPLLPNDSPVTIDLQATFDRCYDAGPYGRRMRYLESTPEPPLTPPQQQWAEKLLQAASRRSSQASVLDEQP